MSYDLIPLSCVFMNIALKQSFFTKYLWQVFSDYPEKLICPMLPLPHPFFCYFFRWYSANSTLCSFPTKAKCIHVDMDKEGAWVMVMNKRAWYAVLYYSLLSTMMFLLFLAASLKRELEFLSVYFQNEFAIHFKPNSLLPTK